jgi:hypothetical protein
LRLGRPASIPRAKTYGAPRRGDSGKGPAVMKYAGIVMTAPFPGALLTGLVAALGPACRLGVAMLTLLRVQFYVAAMRLRLTPE